MCVPACMCTGVCVVCVCVCVFACFPGREMSLYQWFLTLTAHLETPTDLLNDTDLGLILRHSGIRWTQISVFSKSFLGDFSA